MSSNLFDTYTPTEYIPRPFEAYMKAGEAQQGQYNQLRDAMQTQQDAFNNMKVRMVDEERKNEFLSNIQQQALDLYEKNKHYNPDMYGEVRSFMRKAARDPRINAWSTALKNEQDFKDIEKRLKAAGQEPLYSNRHAIETPVYDNKGNMIYNPETTDLGIEQKLQWDDEAFKFVNNKIKPWAVQNNMEVNYVTRQGGDGKSYSMPVLVDSQGKQLRLNDPRVKKALKEIAPEWEGSSTAGRQWKRFNPEANSVDFLSRYVAEVNDVQSSFKPVGGSQFAKFTNSFGGGADDPNAPVDKYNAGILGLNTPKVASKLTNFPQRSETEYVPNAPEAKVINKQAADAYNEYYTAYKAYKKDNKLSSKDASVLRKYTGMSNADLIESRETIPYLKLDHFNQMFTQKRAGQTNPELAESYNRDEWNFDEDIKAEASQHLGSIPIKKTIIYGGEGKQFSLQNLMQDEDGEAPLSNIVRDMKVTGGVGIADPEHNYFRKPHMKVEGTVNLEAFNSLNFKAKKQVQSMATNTPEDAKKTGGYKIEMAIPGDMFSNENSAMNVAQKVMGTDKGYQPDYFRNSTQQYNQLHADAMNRWDDINTNYPKGLEFEPGVIIKANQNTGNYDIIQGGKVQTTISPYDYERIIKNKEQNAN